MISAVPFQGNENLWHRTTAISVKFTTDRDDSVTMPLEKADAALDADGAIGWLD